jgi:ABC-type glycerol-3-phosphate transport system permease component
MIKKILPYLFSISLAGFGLLTLFLSTSVIFDLFGIRAKEGNYVLFVVWSNFISSILYLFAAYGFAKSKKWTATLLGISTIILIAAFIGLKIHANSGGIYETKTIGAMIFRIAVTFVFAIIAFFTINKHLNKNHNE